MLAVFPVKWSGVTTLFKLVAVSVVAATGSGVVEPYPAVGGVAKALMTVLSVANLESAELADCVVAVVPLGKAGVPETLAAVPVVF